MDGAKSKSLEISDGASCKATRPAKPASRLFQGDWDYLRLFNHHVTSFFALEYIDNTTTSAQTKTKLLPSKVSLQAAYYCPESTDDAFETLPGTLWTADEKEQFFNCLARFSIHRLDDFLVHLPRKSRFDIEAYYHLLRRELRKLTKLKTNETSYTDETERTVYHDYTCEVFEQGASYSELPIAHEVDDEWMDYEEEQSIRIGDRDQFLETSRSSRKKKLFSQYVQLDSDDTQNLVNNHEASQVARVFRANTLFPTVEGKTSCRLTFDSVVFLDALIKLRVKELLGAIVVRKGFKGADASDSNHDALDTVQKENRSESVSKIDIWRAAENIRLYETKAAGFSSRERDGKTPVLYSYWQNVHNSLKLSTNKDYLIVEPPSDVRLWEKVKQEYFDDDVFLREVETSSPKLEYSVGLLELGALRKSDESSAGNGSSDLRSATQEVFESVPGESDSTGFESSRTSESPRSSRTENDSVGTSSSDDEEVVASLDKPNVKHFGKRSYNYAELQTFSTFSRKRSLVDMIIEDNLLEKECEWLESIDSSRSARARKALRREFELPATDTETQSAERKKATCSISEMQKLWDKTYARY